MRGCSHDAHQAWLLGPPRGVSSLGVCFSSPRTVEHLLVRNDDPDERRRERVAIDEDGANLGWGDGAGGSGCVSLA